MDFDPQKATGRTMPAQIPIAPRPALAAAEPPSLAQPPVPAAPAPESSTAAAVASTRGLGPVEGTGDPSRLAISPGPPEMVPTIPSLPRPVEQFADRVTDEERTMLYVLRLVDRVISPGTLSPVERAFIAGVKVMFDNLSTECERMLKRKVTDLTSSKAEPSGTPLSVESTTPQEIRQTTRGSSRTSRKTPKGTR